MATYTTNYNLEKPEASDPFGDFRESYNDNLDIIDANLGGGGSGGHTIIDENGSTMPTESKLQFTGNVSVSDDNVNGKTIVDILGGGGGGGTTYTTTEQVVGTWLGKPLYQKTFEHSGALIVDNSFSNNIGELLNVDLFVSCEGCFRRTSANGLMYSLNGGIRPENGADSYRVSNRFYNGYVQVAVNGYNDIEYIALTVRYTKTTD